MKIRFVLIVSILLTCKDIYGQDDFVIVDGRTGKPVEGASVYISGTAFGTVADSQGRFSLKGFPKPPYKLTFSAVGYRSQTEYVAGEIPETLRIKLSETVTELQEVVVGKALKDGWERFGQDFIRNFIGYSSFAKQCRIMNTEVMSFFDDVGNRTLRVRATRPLVIRNEALGYTITYWLEEYEMNYASRTLLIQGSSLFRDMITNKTPGKRRKTWVQNRETAYSGSLQHFMSSLYGRTTASEGFEMRVLRRISDDSASHYYPVKTDTFHVHPPAWDDLRVRLIRYMERQKSPTMTLQANTFVEPMMERIKSWFHDTTGKPIQLQFASGKQQEGRMELPDTIYSGKGYPLSEIDMRQKLVLRKSGKSIMGVAYPVFGNSEEAVRQGTMDVLYRGLLHADDLVKTDASGGVHFGFDNHLHVTYTREKEEEEHVRNSVGHGIMNVRKPAEQTSTISLKGTDRLTLFSNGHFEPSRQLLVEGYWSYEKTDKLLPLEYKPSKGDRK